MLNFIVGGGAASALGIAGTRASAQYDVEAGGYYNIETGTCGAYSTSGIGTAGASGPYGGAFAGAGATIGLIKGGPENVGGVFQNLNIQIPGTAVGIVAYYDSGNKFQGVGITIGPGGGAGLTRTDSRLFPCPKPAPPAAPCK